MPASAGPRVFEYRERSSLPRFERLRNIHLWDLRNRLNCLGRNNGPWCHRTNRWRRSIPRNFDASSFRQSPEVGQLNEMLARRFNCLINVAMTSAIRSHVRGGSPRSGSRMLRWTSLLRALSLRSQRKSFAPRYNPLESRSVSEIRDR